MEINVERLLQDIERYSAYGASDVGGVSRPSFSEADREVRCLFIQELKEMGLAVTVDGAANIWGKKKGKGNKKGSIVIGSHLDTVPNGGKYDGALGTLMAKELIKTLFEKGVVLHHDLEIVSFTAEESNDFNLATFGSRSFTGKLTVEELEKASDHNGKMLKDELKKVGGGLDKFPMMRTMAKEKKAFIELHIEQGKRLESSNCSVAIVDRFVGMYRSNVRVVGQSNHSGTTMMEHRADALTAAAEMVLEVERQCKEDDSDLVGTVGKLNVFPNATNIIPGQVEFHFEVRGGEEKRIYQVVEKVKEKWKILAEHRGVDFHEDVFLEQAPILLDPSVVDILKNTAEEMNEQNITMSSMAIHDAVHMASVAQTAMLFVKSINGKSHCPEEYSAKEDIRKAGNLMLKSIINLDKNLL
ncbi:N-carbamoyl-L-amino-acid hydrolase [Evansella vedderi]|uniref:N-carbamoyl-L-amino-acid hydrolase n=1 Tax=Evansella vedderi TaxID=38282 RepID=A0ABT9ZPD9_9BACI|nr:Zn-dependent hydrolase [Evansella vedderi]MDQ0252815.1 N-carbamoyl-L-amino-acid hydrolase [Evansella vedderi]